MSELTTTGSKTVALQEQTNNLIEKFTSDQFTKITTRAGHEDFALETITDEKMESISNRMSEINRGLNAFAKTNTQFVSLGLTLSEATPERNIRQIHAQIESKRGALAEAQFRLLKQKNDLQRKILKRTEIETSGKYENNEQLRQLDLDKLDIEVEEQKVRMVDGRVHVEQAIKEIGMYMDAYDDIVEANNLENWDENTMEEADETYNLLRCFQQSLRSCRQIGHINEPNQEWLEQLGINPSYVQLEMQMFLEAERKKMNDIIQQQQKGGNVDFKGTMDDVDDFFDHLVQKYQGIPTERIKSRGMKTAQYKDWSYLSKPTDTQIENKK